MTRKFSSISIETTLASELTSTATTMTVASDTAAALLGGVSLAAGNVDQFMVALDPDGISEELVAITGVSGDVFTIVRGEAGTTAITHTAGAKVRHVLTGDDLTSFQATSDALPEKVDADTFTGLGTLIAGTGAGTYATVNAGANGLFLVADDEATGGVSWGSPGNSAPLVFNVETDSYTLILSDAGKSIDMNSGSANTLTIPANADVEFPIGTQILVSQIGAGQTTIAGAAGVTVQANGSRLKLAGQYAQASLIKRNTNTWIVSGNLTA